MVRTCADAYLCHDEPVRRVARIGLWGLGATALLMVAVVTWYELTKFSGSEPQTAPLLLTGATVLVGPDLDPEHRTSVLVDDGLIAAIGEEADAAARPDTARIDIAGLTLMPGLIDLHVHLGTARERGDRFGLADYPQVIANAMRYEPQARRALLGSGVTSVRSLGNEVPWILELRDMVDSADLAGPRIFAAGPVFTTQGGHPVVTLHGGTVHEGLVRVPGTPQEATAEVRALAEQGVDVIKVIQERGGGQMVLDPLPTDVLGAIVTEAHRRDLTVTAHWGTPEDLAEVLVAGVDGLEHLEAREFLPGWPEDVLADLVKRQVPVTTTMVVVEVSAPEEAMRQLRGIVGDFHAAGGRIVAGSDAGMPGVPFGGALHRELELLVEVGMTPQEALRAATSDAADVIGSDAVGVIEVGRSADLVAVDGDPLTTITDAARIELVLRDGVIVVDRAADVPAR